MPPEPVKQSPKPPGPRPIEDDTDGWGSIDKTRMVIFGESSTGKSSFVGTIPGTTLWLVCSGGKKAGELKSVDTPENRKRITPRIINSIESYQRWVKRGHEFDNVVLDHVTGFQDVVLKEILGVDELPQQKTWGLATQQQYGQCTARCKDLLTSLLNLPGNIIVIGQQRIFKADEDNNYDEIIQPVVGVACSPSLAAWIHPSMDMIVQTFKRPEVKEKEVTSLGQKKIVKERTGKIEYCMRIGPHEMVLTKIRTPERTEVPDVIVNPTYERLQLALKGKLDE